MEKLISISEQMQEGVGEEQEKVDRRHNPQTDFKSEAFKRGGRPLGSVEDTPGLVRRETKQHLGLIKRLRDLVEKQVSRIGEDLEGDMGLTQRVEIAEKLADMLSIVGKAVESLGKIEKGGVLGEKEVGEVSLEEVMNEFKGRKG